jgi:hypothetical protein
MELKACVHAIAFMLMVTLAMLESSVTLACCTLVYCVLAYVDLTVLRRF